MVNNEYLSIAYCLLLISLCYLLLTPSPFRI